MGVGIAYVFAAAGCGNTVVEPDPRRKQALRMVLREQAEQGVSRGKLSAEQGGALPGRVPVVAEINELAAGLDLVVESVPERFESKAQVLAGAAKRQPKILATGTSALSVDRLARSLPEPTTFLGMPFFNPVWSLQLVRGAQTSQQTIHTAQALAGLLGKQLIVVRNRRVSRRAGSTSARPWRRSACSRTAWRQLPISTRRWWWPTAIPWDRSG